MRRWLPRARREARLLAEFESALAPRRRATVLGYLWWWRYELLTIIGTGVTIALLIDAISAIWTAVTLTILVSVVASWPPARREFAAVAWRVITPHRLRVGFAQARIHARNGKLPAILHTTRQPFGERVRLWCPAGTAAADFRAARTILAAACWAAGIRVIADARHAHLVTLDVIRYPETGAGHPGTGPHQMYPPATEELGGHDLASSLRPSGHQAIRP